jgi:hypothetical protein
LTIGDPDGGGTCARHTDRDSCVADPACGEEDCPGCNSERVFAVCYDRGGSLPPANHCAPPVCNTACDGLDEATCHTRPDCRPDYCPSCTPGQPAFVGCSPVLGAPPGMCPLPNCPASAPPCGSVTNVSDCMNRADCHPVYEYFGCACANCCCMAFHACASGKADCKGPTTCTLPEPACDDPLCGGKYAVAYANACYAGCVLKSDCAP